MTNQTPVTRRANHLEAAAATLDGVAELEGLLTKEYDRPAHEQNRARLANLQGKIGRGFKAAEVRALMAIAEELAQARHHDGPAAAAPRRLDGSVFL